LDRGTAPARYLDHDLGLGGAEDVGCEREEACLKIQAPNALVLSSAQKEF
jgi:hypothetical protein